LGSSLLRVQGPPGHGSEGAVYPTTQLRGAHKRGRACGHDAEPVPFCSMSWISEQVHGAGGVRWGRATERGTGGRARARLSGIGGTAEALQPASHPTAHCRWKRRQSSSGAAPAPGNKLRRRKGLDDRPAWGISARGPPRDCSDRANSDRQVTRRGRCFSPRDDCSRLELPRAKPRSGPWAQAMPPRLNQPIASRTGASSRLVAPTNENPTRSVTLP